MSDSFCGLNAPIVKALLASTFGILFAYDAVAGNWMRDEGGLPVVTLEQPTGAYLEPEKIAIGCFEHRLFFERYSPAGNAPSSLIRFGDGTEMSVEWNKLDAPNTMWAYDQLADAIVNKVISSTKTVSFQEGPRLVTFHFENSPSFVDCR